LLIRKTFTSPVVNWCCWCLL